MQWVRFSAKLKSLKERLLEGGMLTSKQVCAKLGISRTTIGKLRRDGQLKARICNDHGEWLDWLPEPIPSPGHDSSSTPADLAVTSTAQGAV